MLEWSLKIVLIYKYKQHFHGWNTIHNNVIVNVKFIVTVYVLHKCTSFFYVMSSLIKMAVILIANYIVTL